jgi:predicted transcriptional regulator
MIKRFMTTLQNIPNATSAWEKSCYYKINFKINEKSTVYEAVQKFSAYNIGCLAVTNDKDKIIGLISERDYINKIALLGRSSKSTQVSEICTFEPNISTAYSDDNIHICMNKMLMKNVRHLLVLDKKTNEVIGLMSVKDLIKEVLEEKDDLIKKLGDFKVGKGGYFEHV